eukprot:2415177-Prymnesium_polylepis.1
MKPAKGSYLGGWRRRWIVLDSGGTLTYVNDKHVVEAETRKHAKAQAASIGDKRPLGMARAPSTGGEGALSTPAKGGEGAEGRRGFFKTFGKRRDDTKGEAEEEGEGEDIKYKDEATFNLQLSTVKVRWLPHEGPRAAIPY